GGFYSLLDCVSLLGLVRWGWERAAAACGIAWHAAWLPWDFSKGVAFCVLGAVEALLNVATDLWLELRHLGLRELLTVMLCLLRGESLPPALQPGGGVGGGASGSGAAYGSGPHHHGAPSHSSSASGRESVLPLMAAAFANAGGGGGGGGGLVGFDSGFGGFDLRERLDRINKTAALVSYQERPARAMPRSAAERIRRMMHYDISLRPFQATVRVDDGSPPTDDEEEERRQAAAAAAATALAPEPFMCTPQSFPPTPISRACVMARRSQFADDILFLVRDQLRLDEHSRCPDETTRLTAEFLRRQARLAVLNGHDAAEGIALTCGQHCATKLGSALYSSVRAMVPVLRNRYVFFQFSVTVQEAAIPSLSLGLSTLEMPLNNPVGAWAYSIGLNSTGQILLSSRWYGCPGEACFGVGSTVGILVYLDGAQVFQSWDGEMVRAHVTFSVGGRPVRVALPP
ncbi:unnamed protein product, partial [Phaeothamnion confervicola]